MVARGHNPILIVLLVGVAIGQAAVAQTVFEKDGGIYFRDLEGETRQLSSSGLDSQPDLSPDHSQVVFVRGTPGETVEVGWGDAEAREIRIVGVDGKGERLLVRGEESEVWEKRLAELKNPRFLSDGGHVVFGSALAVTSGVVNVVNVGSGEVERVTVGALVDVVPGGKYKDHLIVGQHRYFLAGGSYDWYWLINVDGSEVGPIGPDEESLKQFSEMYVSSGSP